MPLGDTVMVHTFVKHHRAYSARHELQCTLGVLGDHDMAMWTHWRPHTNLSAESCQYVCGYVCAEGLGLYGHSPYFLLEAKTSLKKEIY